MIILQNRSKKIYYLNKVMRFALYLFAIGLFTSKAATSTGLILYLLLWIIKIVLTDNYKINFTSLKKPIFLHLIIFILSAAFARNIFLLDDSSNKFLAIFFYWALVNEVKDLDFVKRIIKLSIFSAIVAVFYGLYQHYFIGINRVQSFSFSLGFGLHVSMIMAFTLIYLFWGNLNNKNKLMLFIANVLLFMNLIFTKARGAWLAFIGGVLLLVLIKKDKKLIISFIIVLLLLISFLPGEYISRFESSFDLEGDRSIQHRLELWEGAIEIFKDNPVIGIGYDNFRELYVEEYYPDRPYQDGRNAHNLYLHYLANLGILGFLALIYLFYSILKKIFLAYKQTNNYNLQLFFFSSFIAIVIFLLQGFTRVSYGRTDTVRFLWFLISINIIFIENLNIKEK